MEIHTKYQNIVTELNYIYKMDTWKVRRSMIHYFFVCFDFDGAGNILYFGKYSGIKQFVLLLIRKYMKDDHHMVHGDMIWKTVKCYISSSG